MILARQHALISRTKNTESSIAFFLGLSVLFFEVGSYWSWHYWAKWVLIVAIFSTMFAWEIAKRTTFWFFPILLLSLLSAVNSGLWVFNRFNDFKDAYRPDDVAIMSLVDLFSLQKGALYAALTVIIVGLALVWIPKACASGIKSLLAFVSFASAACTITQMGVPSHTRGAFSGNTGMNGSLIAVLLPFWLASLTNKPLRVASILVAVAAILLTQTSVPIGVLAVMAGSYAFSTYRFKTGSTPWAGVGIAALFVAGVLASRDNFFSSSGRFEVWSKIYEWWAANDFWWTGTGLGTASTLIPWAQHRVGAERFGWFIFMHSEPLQILWEMGVPGLLFALIAFTWTAWRAFRHPVLFASLMGIAAEGLFDYPLRLPLSCTSAVFVVWLILKAPQERIPA